MPTASAANAFATSASFAVSLAIDTPPLAAGTSASTTDINLSIALIFQAHSQTCTTL